LHRYSRRHHQLTPTAFGSIAPPEWVDAYSVVVVVVFAVGCLHSCFKTLSIEQKGKRDGEIEEEGEEEEEEEMLLARACARFFVERVGVRHVWWGYAASSEADYVLGNHFDFALRVSLSLTTS